MAEDNNNTNDNQNEVPSSAENKISKDQISIAKELNIVLGEIEQKLSRISTLAQNQSNMAMQIAESFNEVHESVVSSANDVNNISQSINEIAETAVDSLGKGTSEQLTNVLDEVSDAAHKSANTQSENLNSLDQNINKTGGKSLSLKKQMAKIMNELYKHLRKMFDSTSTLKGCLEGLKNAAIAVKDAFIDLKDKVQALFSGLGGKLKSLFGGLIRGAKLVLTSVGAIAGAAAKFFKFSLTVPFTIAKAAADLGNKIRTDLVEIIQASAEDLKESFDFDSYIGKGIQDMTARGKGMLLAFQSPSSEMVKLFGYGATGIANMIKEVGGNIAAMGHFSELFGRSIMSNGSRLKDFTRMVKGFGLSSEDIHYLALDAANNLEHINTRMARLGITLESVSTEFNIDRKRLSKNFMIMRKDITQFGHLSDEEIAKTTARLTQMRVKLEDAAAVFKKFSTFEDAANSVAILSQTFGMNLDAFDMIQAKNPEEIIDMFRNSMLETGRSFEDLNRFEKDLMAQHTGMSAESLAALMNYRDLGLTYEEARKKMSKETPEAKQMASLKKLNSAIKEVQKVLTFNSPFEAFADGLMANTTLSGDLKNTMVSLSSGYQGIFEYAKNLDGSTWTGLVRPINYIINIMRGIFQSKAFKDGLVGTVKVMADFIGNMFGVTNPDRALTELEKQIKSSKSKDGVLDPNVKTPESKAFRKTLLDALKGIKDKNLKAFGGLEGVDRKSLEDIKDPLEIIPLLRKIQKEAQKNTQLQPYFEDIMDNLESRLGDINLKDGTISKEQKSAIEKLVEGLKEVGKATEGNRGKLVSLSLRVTGAIIKGAGVGIVAILKLVNNGIDSAKEYLKKQGKDTNLIEEFLHFKPGEFGQLGTEINKGIKAFMANSEGMFSLTSWLLNGLGDMFTVILEFFMGTLSAGMDEMFGTSMSKTGKVSLAKTKLPQGRKNTTAESMSNVISSTEKGKDAEVEIDDVSSLLNELNSKIKSVKDTKTSSALQAAVDSLKKSFLKKDLTQNQMKDIGLKATGLLTGITDSGKYTGDVREIDDFTRRSQFDYRDRPKYITNAERFDKLLKDPKVEKYIAKEGQKVNSLIKNDKFTDKFNNDEFLSFWIRNHAQLTTGLSQTKYLSRNGNLFSLGLTGHYEDYFKNEPYYNTFKDLLNVKRKKEQEKTPVPKSGGEKLTSKSKNGEIKEVEDLTWLEKLSSISAYKNILSNLMYSVSPLITSEDTRNTAVAPNYSEYNPESNYSEVSNLNIDRKTKGLTKQKAQELYDNLCKFKDEVKDQKSHHEINVKLDARKAAIELCKAGLLNIMESPQHNEGGKYLTSKATRYRTGNEGSHGESASSSLIS